MQKEVRVRQKKNKKIDKLGTQATFSFAAQADHLVR